MCIGAVLSSKTSNQKEEAMTVRWHTAAGFRQIYSHKCTDAGNNVLNHISSTHVHKEHGAAKRWTAAEDRRWSVSCARARSACKVRVVRTTAGCEYLNVARQQEVSLSIVRGSAISSPCPSSKKTYEPNATFYQPGTSSSLIQAVNWSRSGLNVFEPACMVLMVGSEHNVCGRPCRVFPSTCTIP